MTPTRDLKPGLTEPMTIDQGKMVCETQIPLPVGIYTRMYTHTCLQGASVAACLDRADLELLGPGVEHTPLTNCSAGVVSFKRRSDGRHTTIKQSLILRPPCKQFLDYPPWPSQGPSGKLVEPGTSTCPQLDA